MSFLSSRFIGMRDFLVVWSGQTVSRLGTYMTFFALVDFWLWEETGSAAALATVLSLSTAGAIYFLSAFAMFVVGASGFFVTNLYHLEMLVPDFAAPGVD